MKVLFFLFSGPLAIVLFGLLCLIGNPVWLSGIIAAAMYAGFLYSELKEFI